MDSGIIEQMIMAGLPDAEVRVSGDDGVHFEAVVISPSFVGKTTLQRHRMVYGTLGDKMGMRFTPWDFERNFPLPMTPTTDGGD